MKINVFGKKRIAEDIVIPSEITEENVYKYLSDLCHEWATSGNSEVSEIVGKSEYGKK